MTAFTLSKYYLDVADVWGDVYIGYWLQLRAGTHALCGYQHLLHTPEHGTRTHAGIGHTQPPLVDAAGNVAWHTAHARGDWTAAATPIEATLIDTAEGSVAWHCLLPKADAAVALRDRVVRGRGYVERIDVTLPIWALPMTTLYWGRAHSVNHALVWIRWTGPSDCCLLWVDDALTPAAVIDDRLVAADGLALPLPRDISLRQGQLTATVLRPFLDKLNFLPRAALALDEAKWFGCADLAIDGLHEQATVLFERVTW